jgi:hypothetical protein
MAESAVAQTAIIRDEPGGIGGWLILVAMGQVFGPIRAALNMLIYYVDPNTLAVFNNFPVAMWGEVVINVAYVVFAIYASYTFFAQKRIFKGIFTAEFAAALVLVAMDMAWVATASGMTIDGSKFGDDFGRAIGGALLGIVWIPYIWLSKRARNTFVN